MTDPFEALAGILRDVAKGRGTHGIGRPMSEKVGDVVKEGMTYFAEIDEAASIEWAREDISNYDPDQIQALLNEIQKVWKKETWEWACKTYNAVPMCPPAGGCDDCELGIEEK